NDMNVEHVPVLGANGPQADGTWPNHQEVREQQQVIPGTTMETNFPRPGSSPGVVEPPPRPEAPPAPEQPAPRYAMPGTTAPKLDASPNTGGQRATGLVTGSRNSLDVFISPGSPGASIAGLTLKPRTSHRMATTSPTNNGPPAKRWSALETTRSPSTQAP